MSIPHLRPPIPTGPQAPLHPIKNSMTAIDVTPYLGRLWDDKEWNCYSLVRAVFSDVFSIELPDFSNIHPDDGAKVVLAFTSYRSRWPMVAKKADIKQKFPIGCPGDVVLFRIAMPRKLRYHENHIGIIVEPGRFLHVRRGTHTTAPSLTDPEWRDRAEAIHRHPSFYVEGKPVV